MYLASWLGFQRLASRSTPAPGGRRGTALSVEILEDRCLLSSGPSATLVADIVPGAASSNPTSLTVFNGALLFTAVNPKTGYRDLWKSDGTTAGTALLKGGTFGYLDYTPVGGTLLFTSGNEIWKTDGTKKGTVFVKAIQTGNILRLTAAGTRAYFSIGDDTGTELWVTDGTKNGTKRLKDIYPGTITIPGWGTFINSSEPGDFTDLNGRLMFTAADGVNGRELWTSDGTESGTKLVKDIVPGLADSTPQSLRVVNGVLFFNAAGGLWKSDGTAAGTVLVKNVDLNFRMNVNGTQFFRGPGSTTQYGLWKSDGTTAGTVLVKDLAESTISSLAIVNGIYFFKGPGETTELGLWKSDGTAAGTVFVKDIALLASTSSAMNVNGSLYLIMGGGSSNGGPNRLPPLPRQLWKSDGTEAGTVLLKEFPAIYSSGGYIHVSGLINVNGLVYFVVDDGVHGREPWQSDGTEAGTVMVRDIYPGSTGSDPAYLTVMNNKLYFAATDPDHGRELWDPPAEEPVSSAYPGASVTADVSSPGLSGAILWGWFDPTAGLAGPSWGYPSEQGRAYLPTSVAREEGRLPTDEESLLANSPANTTSRSLTPLMELTQEDQFFSDTVSALFGEDRFTLAQDKPYPFERT